MKNTQNIAIVMLMITAAILTGLLVGVYCSTSQEAQAFGSMRGGDYIVCNSPYVEARDIVYVIDVSARKLVCYGADEKTGSFDLLAKTDLDRAFGGTTESGGRVENRGY